MRRLLPGSASALAVTVLACGAATAAFAARAAPLKITSPARALQGKVAVVSVKTKSYGCKLSVRFSNGDTQKDMPATQVVSGKVTWQWQVPQFAAAGQAKLTVACAGAGKATKTIIVVGGLIPPHIPIINAASQYNLGGEISFNGAPTISALEVVVDPGAKASSAKSFSPALDNVHLLPSPFDPPWLGSVEGDIINVHPSLTMDSAQLSCVVFDANGNVLGGGLGGANFKLLPGTRSFFKIAGGLDPIVFNNAASVAVSIVPQYESTS